MSNQVSSEYSNARDCVIDFFSSFHLFNSVSKILDWFFLSVFKNTGSSLPSPPYNFLFYVFSHSLHLTQDNFVELTNRSRILRYGMDLRILGFLIDWSAFSEEELEVQ